MERELGTLISSHCVRCNSEVGLRQNADGSTSQEACKTCWPSAITVDEVAEALGIDLDEDSVDSESEDDEPGEEGDDDQE